MARRLDSVYSPIIHGLLLAVLASLLAGCASTEELYAEYDEALCKLVIEKDTSGQKIVRDLISDTYMKWEPAVYFDFDADDLSNDEKLKLDSAVKILKRFPTILLGLQGFTDHIGASSYNKKLALRRVKSVKDYLTSHGISPARQLVQPIGEEPGGLGSGSASTRAIHRLSLIHI